MKKIIIATANKNKIKEIRSYMRSVNGCGLFSLSDFGISIDVPEDGSSLEENALIKARKYYDIIRLPVLSDDTGLFVDGLNGDPGVFSSRYAGENATYTENCTKLLNEMNGIPIEKRSARFESVLCFYINEKDFYLFKGVCSGKIIFTGRGINGFGYDPLFVPDGSEKTFAELTDEEKNNISHRAIALQKFRSFIEAYLK